LKLFHYWLAAAGALSLCACAGVPSPSAPSAVALVAPGAASLAAGFEPDFFRAFLQNGFETPNHLEPVRLLRGPLRIYLRTHDNSGRAVDALTLDTAQQILIDGARTWSGDTFGVEEVVRGAGTREKVPGWITVKWAAAPMVERCGRSTVGVDGGYIELDISGACSCGSPAGIYSRLVRHELGHAMGYYHTDSSEDVMYGRSISSSACDVLPSSRERLHAKLAHGSLH
jgi:hypothetical protein